jgi:hypothetical protein
VLPQTEHFLTSPGFSLSFVMPSHSFAARWPVLGAQREILDARCKMLANCPNL